MHSINVVLVYKVLLSPMSSVLLVLRCHYRSRCYLFIILLSQLSMVKYRRWTSSLRRHNTTGDGIQPSLNESCSYHYPLVCRHPLVIARFKNLGVDCLWGQRLLLQIGCYPIVSSFGVGISRL